MGIDADEYFVMNGLASLGNCYLRVRNFHMTKVANMYTFNYQIEIFKDNKYVTHETITIPSVEMPITENIWKIGYDNLKEYLTSKGINFVDNL